MGGGALSPVVIYCLWSWRLLFWKHCIAHPGLMKLLWEDESRRLDCLSTPSPGWMTTFIMFGTDASNSTVWLLFWLKWRSNVLIVPWSWMSNPVSIRSKQTWMKGRWCQVSEPWQQTCCTSLTSDSPEVPPNVGESAAFPHECVKTPAQLIILKELLHEWHMLM